MCAQGCDPAHGQCVGPNDCKCSPGWSGANCSVCQPSPFTASASPNMTFTVSTQVLQGCAWVPGTVVAMEATGSVSRVVTAGRAEWKLFELGASGFVAAGTAPYFHCTPSGCDPTKPIALTLTDPTSPTSGYALSVPMTLPAATASGHFQVEVVGQDESPFPYDFDLRYGFNYTAAGGGAQRQRPRADPAWSVW